MYSSVATGIFAVRNVDKAQNGEKGRWAVAAAQFTALGAKIASEVNKLDNKVINFATKSVNPLIVGSSVLEVVCSKDPVETGVAKTGAIASMFAGEKLMAANWDKVVGAGKTIHLTGGKGVALKGVAHVANSILCYKAGEIMSRSAARAASASINGGVSYAA